MYFWTSDCLAALFFQSIGFRLFHFHFQFHLTISYWEFPLVLISCSFCQDIADILTGSSNWLHQMNVLVAVQYAWRPARLHIPWHSRDLIARSLRSIRSKVRSHSDNYYHYVQRVISKLDHFFVASHQSKNIDRGMYY